MNGYLGIDTITTGGYNPRANASVERFMQSMNGALRKCSNSEYKDIKNYLQAIAFVHNTTFHSSINCTPFECGHGLQARSITDARMSPRLQIVDEEGTELQETVTQCDTSIHKKVLELAERLKDDAVRHSQWHKKMTADNLNMAGKKIEDNLYETGAEVYYFKPPTQAQVREAGKMHKHLAFYHGPATIVEKLGTRQYSIKHNGKPYKRDVEMLIPVPQLPETYREFDPAETVLKTIKPCKHSSNLELREGELLIMLDEEENKWYLAEITKKYQDRVQVNYYSTPAQSLDNYPDSSLEKRRERISQAHFRKTWFVYAGKNAGKGTLQAPFPTNPETRIWEGHIPKEDYEKCLLIRNAHITASGKLSKETLDLVTKLNCSHGTTLTVQDEQSEPTPSSLFTCEHSENLRVEQISQQLFNYSQTPLCHCIECEKELTKNPKEDINSCECFLCGAKSLAH